MNNIVNKFQINGDVISIERYGFGHINETYLVKTTVRDYILQKINHHIFHDVKGLMNNISQVLDFCKKAIIAEKGDPNREAMTLVLTNNKENYYYDAANDSYYRMYLFVEHSVAIQNATSKEEFAESGQAFGKFQKLLAKFDASKLIEPIKNFHNTKVRYEHFLTTLEKDRCHRAFECKAEIDFVLKHQKDCNRIVDLIATGKIPLKVTHNDTKLNNILFDDKTHKSLCVIDLDTIMPGSSLYDFGDSIRFGCNTTTEDNPNTEEVDFNFAYFKAYTEAYLSEVVDTMNREEINNLAFSAILMTLECGIRFLDDYLDGDHYFATKRVKHNLDRARTQFRLVEIMEKNLDLMNNIVEDVVHSLSK